MEKSIILDYAMRQEKFQFEKPWHLVHFTVIGNSILEGSVLVPLHGMNMPMPRMVHSSDSTFTRDDEQKWYTFARDDEPQIVTVP